ncbi:MAG: serine/threonine protein kinase [Verrucomicrobiota bacterium]|nr:serine/threonine protein kinase [Verrucomicrobiota bacterium]
MPSSEPETLSQNCPACGLVVDVTEQEPVARVECPGCGEKFRIERTFDNFELLETLGVGGMGSVYKARDTRLDRFVALKILRKELSADPAEARRLEQEARATAAVNDPHVVQVFSSGTHHGQFYLVMELVDFGSLDDLMAEHGRLLEAEVLETGLQVAKGLKAAHEKGLIHRDIKPGNILFGSEHAAKIGDFGLAVAAGQNAESQNEIWGTPYYVAPERLNNEPEDFRSDIYSLGATLYHAIAGRPPIEGETNSASALRDLKNHPLSLAEAAPGLRRETVRTLDRMVAPDPNDRFASYDELIENLAGAVEALNPSVQKPKRKAADFGGTRRGAPARCRRGLSLRSKTKTRNCGPHAGGRPHAPALVRERARRAHRREIRISPHRIHATLDRDSKQAAAPELDPAPSRPGEFNSWLYDAGAPGVSRTRSGGTVFEKAGGRRARRFLRRHRANNDHAGSGAGQRRRHSRSESPRAFALLLFAMKDWQLSDFANAAALLEQFVKSEPAGAVSWNQRLQTVRAKISRGLPHLRGLEETAASDEQRGTNSNSAQGPA